jgi:hypothetical protein
MTRVGVGGGMSGNLEAPFIGGQFSVDRAITHGFSLQLHGAEGLLMLPSRGIQMNGRPIDTGDGIRSFGGILRYATHPGSPRLVAGLGADAVGSDLGQRGVSISDEVSGLFDRGDILVYLTLRQYWVIPFHHPVFVYAGDYYSDGGSGRLTPTVWTQLVFGMNHPVWTTRLSVLTYWYAIGTGYGISETDHLFAGLLVGGGFHLDFGSSTSQASTGEAPSSDNRPDSVNSQFH